MNKKNNKLKKQLKKHSGVVSLVRYEQAKRTVDQTERVLRSPLASAEMKARAQEVRDQEQRIVDRVFREMTAAVHTVSLQQGI